MYVKIQVKMYNYGFTIIITMETLLTLCQRKILLKLKKYLKPGYLF